MYTHTHIYEHNPCQLYPSSLLSVNVLKTTTTEQDVIQLWLIRWRHQRWISFVVWKLFCCSYGGLFDGFTEAWMFTRKVSYAFTNGITNGNVRSIYYALYRITFGCLIARLRLWSSSKPRLRTASNVHHRHWNRVKDALCCWRQHISGV